MIIEVDLSKISPTAKVAVEDLLARRAADARTACSVKDAAEILGVSEVHVHRGIGSGALVAYLDGAARRINLDSIYRRMINAIIEANPAGGPVARRPFIGQTPQGIRAAGR